MLSLARRFRKNTAAIAAVEFALILPILILIIFSLIEFSYYFMTRSKVQNFVYQAADIVSRESDNEIDQAQIDAVFDNLDVVSHDRLERFTVQKAVIMYEFDTDPDCENPFDTVEACEPIARPAWYYNDGFPEFDMCSIEKIQNNANIRVGKLNSGYLSNTPVVAVFFNVEFEPIISGKLGVSSDISAHRIMTMRSGNTMTATGNEIDLCP